MRHMMWAYPFERYYYDWYDETPSPEPSDREIKSALVDRLRENPLTSGDHIRVDVEHRVVVLTGDVSSALVKRAAGDDAWDTAGVIDVSNQLSVASDRR
jgi:osmotically-inducible protein OsmY